MADSYTANLNLTKPEVGASRDTWGTKTNADWDAVDALFAAAGSGTSVGLNVGSGKTLAVAGTLTLTGTMPLVTGGSAVSSTLTLKSTSGVGTSDSIAFKVGNNGATTAMTANTSGNIEFRAGTAALPALTTTGDTNTGMFFPAADTIAFTEGGAEAMRIDSSGNVGIGTTAPTRLLTLSSSGVNTRVQINNTVSGKNFGLYAADDGNSTINYGTSSDLLFTESGTERMRINSSGNVGIGTASPSTKLHVAGELTLGPVSTEGGQVTFQNPDASTGLVIDVSTANNARIFNTTNNFNLQIGQIVGTGGTIDFYTGAASRASINSSGVFSFNSGYGSAAVAYGCRAWVNFNGTGTVAIRASGNVTSITDNGVGSYTVNFTTAMPNTNYCVTGACEFVTLNTFNSYFAVEKSTVLVGSVKVRTGNSSTGAVDVDSVFTAIFR